MHAESTEVTTAVVFGRRARVKQASSLPAQLVLLGPPGVGKGTQADMLARTLGACHLSTGHLFRCARNVDPRKRSPALTAALDHMRRGELVPDGTVLAVLRDHLHCVHRKGGFLLDGFPRTVPQAHALDRMLAARHLELDAVLSYELPEEQIVARLSGRRTCPGCDASYHLDSRPPRLPETCDHCMTPLVQREDDRPESIWVRLATYQKNTAPVADFYRKRDQLISISADGAPKEVFDRTIDALQSLAGVAAVPPV